MNTQEEQLQGLSNEHLLQAIWRINSLQRSLSIMALTWASCLHDAAAAALPVKQRPKLLTSVNLRPSGGGGASVPQVQCLIRAMRQIERIDRHRLHNLTWATSDRHLILWPICQTQACLQCFVWDFCYYLRTPCGLL